MSVADPEREVEIPERSSRLPYFTAFSPFVGLGSVCPNDAWGAISEAHCAIAQAKRVCGLDARPSRRLLGTPDRNPYINLTLCD
jgi:hypothetical protein